jgi:hypothetical protein
MESVIEERNSNGLGVYGIFNEEGGGLVERGCETGVSRECVPKREF